MVEFQEPHLDAVFHALGDATRRGMLHSLAQGERTVGQLAEPLQMSLAAASKHVKALEAAGLIRREIRGRMPHLPAGRRAPGDGDRRGCASTSSSGPCGWTGWKRCCATTPCATPPQRHPSDPLRRRRLTPPSPPAASCGAHPAGRHACAGTPRARRPAPPTTQEPAMSDPQFNDQHGQLADGHTLRLQRRLPGPIDRVWAYLTDSDLRRQWLASGTMPLQVGASFELVWRNDELSASPAERPDGFDAESRATCLLEAVTPQRHLRYLWPDVGEVTIDLEPAGDAVLLTLTHRRLVGERLILNVCAGWHAHLALLVARLEGRPAPSLWALWTQLRAEYEALACAS